MLNSLRRFPAAFAALVPSDGPRIVAVVAVLGVVSAAAGAGHVPAPLGVAIWAVGLVLLFRTLAAHARAERLATKLVPGAMHRIALAESLPRVARLLADVEHRTRQSHPVTGLPTREHLLEMIAGDRGAFDDGGMLAVLRFADFDRLAAFRQHDADRMLAAFAARLAVAIGSANVLAQVDRDCFAIWFRAGRDSATAQFRAILYVAAQEIVADGMILTPTTEAGIAHPGDAADEPLRLLTRAVAGLARAGTTPNGDIILAEPLPADEARACFLLEQDLVRALSEGQMKVVFQPVVDLAQGRLIGAEALMRWDHPELGPISPARFIPIVEAAGMSDRYGLWALNAACREARLWQDEGHHGLRVAVNLSAHQLLDPALPLKIARTLERHGLAPSALELELTETAAMADASRTRALFAQLASMGISLAIDDFGSGYSSLSYLKNLPFSKLKIDREFVTAVHERRDSQAICKALIALGDGLDLTVLAEGVEQAEEVAALRALGCTVFQGYYFSRPIDGVAFRKLARDPAWCASLRGPSPLPLFDQARERLSA